MRECEKDTRYGKRAARYGRLALCLLTTAALRTFAGALLYRFSRSGIHASRPAPLGNAAAGGTLYFFLVASYKLFKFPAACRTLVLQNGHTMSPQKPLYTRR